VELFDYLNAVRRRWYVPAALVVVAIIVVLLITDSSPERPDASRNITYTATAILISDGSTQGASANLALTAFLVKRGDIPDLAAELLGSEEEPDVLARRVTATANAELGILEISSSGKDPDEVVETADAFAAATIEYFADKAERSYQNNLDRISQRIDRSRADMDALNAELGRVPPGSVEARRIQAQLDATTNQFESDTAAFREASSRGPASAGVSLLDSATAVASESDDSGFQAPQSRAGRLLAGAGIALGVGIVLALVIDRLDTRLRTRDDFEDAFGAPVLTEIPAVAKRKSHNFYPALQPARRMSVHREAHRSLRTQLQLRINEHAASGERRTVIVVTSALPREGKTTTVASLAASFAETGRSVLVLSADFRRPSIHHHLGVAEDGPGLAEVLAGELHLAECMVDTAVPGVSLVPRGTSLSHPQNLLDHGAELLDAARQLADVVLVDTAPVLLSADTAEIIVRADHVVAVGRAGRTGRTPAIRASELIASLTELAGVVIVGAAVEGAARYAYYYGEPSPVAPAMEPTNGSSPAPEPAGTTAAVGSGPRHAAVRGGSLPAEASAELYRRQPGCFVVAGLGGVIGHISGTIGDIPLSDDALFVWEALTVPVTADAIASSLARVTGIEPAAAGTRTTAALEELVGAGLVAPVP
jgi:capsular exopolysaccharide synthesis family protein